MRHLRGFTLMELMITVAIVAILAAVAYPSYVSYLQRSHRTDARNTLLQIQVAQEKYFLSNNHYGTMAQLTTAAAIPGVTLSGSTYYSPEKYYTIAISPASPTTTYTATATPPAGGVQSKDTYCAQFQITNTGDKSGTTNADCWTK